MTETPPEHVTLDTQNILHAASDLRKTAENTAKQHINTIWQQIESWPAERIEALIADLKKHL